MFERFLNPGRNEMPDIDLDFDERRRGDMIRYATEKYGADHVAQIVTFSTIKAKQAIRDSARVLGFPYKLGDDLAKAMPPPVLGKEHPERGLQLGRAADGPRQAAPRRRVPGHRGRPGGLLPPPAGGARGRGGDLPRPAGRQVPIMKREADGAIITQYLGMNGVAKLRHAQDGLPGPAQPDGALDDTLVHLRGLGIDLDLEALPTDDPATFGMLQAGDSDSVFQMESEGMRAAAASSARTASRTSSP